jgi:hypothetical protein
MPFISALGTATSLGIGNSFVIQGGGSGGGGGDQPYTGTLYYYEGSNETDTTSTWATLGKWYKNSTHTQQASALPTASNATVLLNDTSVDLESWTAPASIDITGHKLTLNAHEQSVGCPLPQQFDVEVTADSSSVLEFNGHIIVTGINHPLYYFKYTNSTYYYFDADIAVNDYIYQSQYSNNIAAVSLVFTAYLEDPNDVGVYKLYELTTDNTGKVTLIEPYDIVPPENPDIEVRDDVNDASLVSIGGSSKFMGYAPKFAVSVCPLDNNADFTTYHETVDSRTGPGNKYFLPPDFYSPNPKNPVYIIAERQQDGSLEYLPEPLPFGGSLSVLTRLYVAGNLTTVTAKLYTMNQYGYIDPELTQTCANIYLN